METTITPEMLRPFTIEMRLSVPVAQLPTKLRKQLPREYQKPRRGETTLMMPSSLGAVIDEIVREGYSKTERPGVTTMIIRMDSINQKPAWLAVYEIGQRAPSAYRNLCYEFIDNVIKARASRRVDVGPITVEEETNRRAKEAQTAEENRAKRTRELRAVVVDIREMNDGDAERLVEEMLTRAGWQLGGWDSLRAAVDSVKAGAK